MKPSQATLKKHLRELRHVVEHDPDPIVRRLAYQAETSIRWATQDTVGWPTPVKDVLANARLLHEEK